jgi:hypothetical protein
MHAPIPPYRGPRPWRAPRSGAERLQLAAWIQLAVVGLYMAGLAAIAIAVAHLGGFCMDSWERACHVTRGPSAAFDVSVALAGVYGVAVSALPVAIARLHRLGLMPRGAVLAGLAFPVPAACALTALVG